jgi:hypothetical protein
MLPAEAFMELRPYTLRAFTKFSVASKIEGSASLCENAVRGPIHQTGAFMPATGELIRCMNYVEDMTNTLRRIAISIPPMPSDERKRLADSLRAIQSAIDAALADLDKAGH